MAALVGRFRTSDGRWRVEVWRDGRDHWYRVLRGPHVVADGAVIGTVEHVLREAGIDMADLIEDPGT